MSGGFVALGGWYIAVKYDFIDALQYVQWMGTSVCVCVFLRSMCDVYAYGTREQAGTQRRWSRGGLLQLRIC
jgi:hypothetical protein